MHKGKIIIIFIIVLGLLSTSFVLFTINNNKNVTIHLNGNSSFEIEVFEKYEDEGSVALYNEDDISHIIVTENNIDNKHLGTYDVIYKVSYKGKKASVKRTVNVVDKTAPIITLLGDEKETLYLNDGYEDSGYKAIDNYDKDITNKVVVKGSVNPQKEGIYTITYEVEDSSGNKASIKREVMVKQRPLIHHDGVAVLNYHFFYNGEYCGGGQNCMPISNFESQLQYLKENDYKTLTMEEFRAWMYNEIEIPKNSVLITIDDGAYGTGKNNGNYLIPMLEKYEMHATLFLITGWWDISNYKSDYLDIESHTHDMHTEGYCSGVRRGAKMLCLTHDEVIDDLKKSMAVTQSNKAFCYPFYAYDENAINNLKEVGFQLAFAGGGVKATRNANKFAIPRYQMLKSTTMDEFIRMVY